MRLAIISDTHLPRGARALPAACVDELRRADAILHAGDFIERSVLEELQALGPPVHAVRGNVDSAELQARLPRGRCVSETMPSRMACGRGAPGGIRTPDFCLRRAALYPLSYRRARVAS